tara:strand:+ start:2674 stop:3102 length:429 start_codon:yes stop_codon:yes gene_type:complete
VLGLFRQKKKDPRERRRMYRLPEKNAMLVLDGVSYAIADWSIEGFRALGFRGGYAAGDTARVRLIIVHRGRPIGFDAKAKILRADPDSREIAGNFLSMSTSARKNIARVYRERLGLHQAAGDVGDEVDRRAISRALQSKGLE